MGGSRSTVTSGQLSKTAAGGRSGATDPDRAPSGALLMEVAWEVCNQLGGIYQVIRSKAPRMVGRWKNRYAMIGPFNPSKAALEFEEKAPPPNSWLARALEHAKREGVVVHCGHWLIPGRPRVLLVEHDRFLGQIDALKYKFYAEHGVEFPAGDRLIDGVVTFAEAARVLLWAIALHWKGAGEEDHHDSAQTSRGNGVLAGSGASGSATSSAAVPHRMVAHCHEWMGGLVLCALRKENAPISLVFTTHATQLGRTCAWNDEWFYDHLPFLNDAHEAHKFNVKTQHGVEKACAHSAHVFTTVSGITGEECVHLLHRQPDLITPNGLNIQHYNVGHEFQTMHAQFKERINRFVMGHFFPSYSFDLDNTLYFFTSGRFEPRNKGFDVCIEAMARLNAELKSAKIDRTVVLFIVTQRATRSLHPQALSTRGVLNELDEVCTKVVEEVREKLFRGIASGERVRLDELVSEYWRLRLRRTQHALRTDRLPMVVTHLLEDDQKDEVLNQIRNVWLFNRADDPVKIVYHPEFISPTNPLWGLEYEQFVRGCHLGIFPSAYEPWGYTPLECLAMGVPAITSDLAGFGRYVEDTLPDLAGGFGAAGAAAAHAHDPHAGESGGGGGGGGGGRPGGFGAGGSGGGICVLKRRGRTFSEAAGDLSQQLLAFCKLDRRDRIALRNEVERRSWEFDWTELGKSYDWAHDLAMARHAAEK